MLRDKHTICPECARSTPARFTYCLFCSKNLPTEHWKPTKHRKAERVTVTEYFKDPVEPPTIDQYRAVLAQCVDVLLRMRTDASRRWASAEDNPYLKAIESAKKIL